MKKSEPISAIRRRFKKEWLLIRVDKVNPSTFEPLRGRLLIHSPHKNEIEKKTRSLRGHVLVIHSNPALPKGYAAAF